MLPLKIITQKKIIFLPRFNFQTIQTFFLGHYYNIPEIKKSDLKYKKCSTFVEAVIENFRNLFSSEIEFMSFNLSYPEEIIIRDLFQKKN